MDLGNSAQPPQKRKVRNKLWCLFSLPKANEANDLVYLSDPPKPLDMKELLTEMPRLGDRYGSLMNEPQVSCSTLYLQRLLCDWHLDFFPQDSERHIYHWQQCLEQCSQLISQTCNTINAIQSPNVIQEVINSDKGTEYLTGKSPPLFCWFCIPSIEILDFFLQLLLRSTKLPAG